MKPEQLAEEYERELELSNDLWRKDEEDLVVEAYLAGYNERQAEIDKLTRIYEILALDYRSVVRRMEEAEARVRELEAQLKEAEMK